MSRQQAQVFIHRCQRCQTGIPGGKLCVACIRVLDVCIDQKMLWDLVIQARVATFDRLPTKSERSGLDSESPKILGSVKEQEGKSQVRCKSCDDPIPEKRLKLVPGTKYCVECQVDGFRTRGAMTEDGDLIIAATPDQWRNVRQSVSGKIPGVSAGSDGGE